MGPVFETMLIRALTTERANAKCKPILPFKPKMPTPLEVVKCNYCKKRKKEKKGVLRWDFECRIAL